MIEATGAAAALSEAQLLEIHHVMVTSRCLSQLLPASESGVAAAATTGREAVAGCAYALESGDLLLTTEADLAASLAAGLGAPAAALEWFGRAAAPSRGRIPGLVAGGLHRGPMMAAPGPAVAAALGVGAALALQAQFRPSAVLVIGLRSGEVGGDGTEALHAAVDLRLPAVFVAEGGGGSARGAVGGRMPSIAADRTDVLGCHAATNRALEWARSGRGPMLVVLVDAAEESAVADPISRFEDHLRARGLLDRRELEQRVEAIEDDVAATVAWARDQAPARAEPIAGSDPGGSFAPQPEAQGSGPEGTILDAIGDALRVEMERDERVVVLVGRGAPPGIAAGLADRFGLHRVVAVGAGPAPVLGAAVGAAVAGVRPVVLLGDDGLPSGVDVLRLAAVRRWVTGAAVPFVVIVPGGSGAGDGPFRFDSPEALLAGLPGVVVAVPATPAAAKGLTQRAIRVPDPVVIVTHRRIAGFLRGRIPPGDAALPIGSASIVRRGSDVTVVAWGAAVRSASVAAEVLAAEGVSVEVIDLQTVMPLDWETVVRSVRSTSRLVVVDDDVLFGGIASELAARAATDLFWDLDGPIVRVTPPHSHVPAAAPLEDAFVPRVEDIVTRVRALGST